MTADFNRRQLLGVLPMPTAALADTDHIVKLPAPAIQAAGELMAALKARRSTRAFAAKPLPMDLLSTLLWAAFGVNRPESGGRTAPSAHGWQEVEVYAVLADAAYRYDARANALVSVAKGDLRALTGVQDFVGTAPLNLVYVADFERMKDASDEDHIFYASADAGVIAQNVYLFCAANRLATVVRGLVDRKHLAPALGLGQKQRIVLAQTVGYPA